MSKIRIFMIDDNENLRTMVKEYCSQHEKLELVLEANDGKEGYEILKDRINDYDVILLDLIMPIRDGIYVLNNMKKENLNKNVIVLTSYSSPETIRQAADLGASYYILKPFDLDNLEERIIECMNENKNSSTTINLKHNKISVSITNILHELGIPSHIKGYQYIREGISMIYENSDLIGAITKELYPKIAQKYDTTVSRVERAIRHAVEVSWNRGDWDLMEEIFGHSVDIDRSKPTNSEFIVTIADKLMLENHKIGI